MVLASDGLRLRPFRRGDPDEVAFLRLMAADPVARQWSPSLRRIESDDHAVAWIEERLGRDGTHEWVVEDSGDAAVLGRIGLHRHAPDGDLEVGYWTLPAARSTGVARRATRTVARYAHEQLAEPRVALVHAVANPASCRVALAASFREEGTMRAVLDHGDGIRHDIHVHARLAADPWDALAAPVIPRVPATVPGDGVVLRPWTQSGAATVWRVAGDPAVTAWDPFGLHSLDDARRWVDRVAGWAAVVAWAVHDAGTGAVVGGILLQHIDATNSGAEVGYWVVPEARGRGVAGRALDAAAGYAFGALGLERLTLLHAVENSASCRVAAKSGFLREGTARRAYRYGDGELHDEHVHARLRTDPPGPVGRHAPPTASPVRGGAGAGTSRR